MLYINRNDDKLNYFCKTCNSVYKHDDSDYKVNTIIFSRLYNNDIIINKTNNNITNLLEDKTLPKIKGKCFAYSTNPKKEHCCIKEDTKLKDIIFIKYNSEELKYLYICTECKCSWTNN